MELSIQERLKDLPSTLSNRFIIDTSSNIDFLKSTNRYLSTTPLILHLAYLHIYLSDFLFRQLQRGNMIDLYPFQKREHY